MVSAGAEGSGGAVGGTRRSEIWDLRRRSHMGSRVGTAKYLNSALEQIADAAVVFRAAVPYGRSKALVATVAPECSRHQAARTPGVCQAGRCARATNAGKTPAKSCGSAMGYLATWSVWLAQSSCEPDADTAQQGAEHAKYERAWRSGFPRVSLLC